MKEDDIDLLGMLFSDVRDRRMSGNGYSRTELDLVGAENESKEEIIDMPTGNTQLSNNFYSPQAGDFISRDPAGNVTKEYFNAGNKLVGRVNLKGRSKRKIIIIICEVYLN